MYPCDQFFIFIMMINLIITQKQTHLLFQNIPCYFWMITWMNNANIFQIAKVRRLGIAQLLLNFFANFSLMLIMNVLLIKKRVFDYTKYSFKNKKEKTAPLTGSTFNEHDKHLSLICLQFNPKVCKLRDSENSLKLLAHEPA